MSTTIAKTKKPATQLIFAEVAGPALEQVDVIDNASKVTVVLGATKATGDVEAEIYGRAGNAALKDVAATTSVYGDVSVDNTITLTDVKAANVYGGGLALDVKGKIASRGGVASVSVAGNSTINLNNVNVKNVFGGGAGYGATSIGNVEINYKGGKVSAIYGGGDRADVYGDVTINVAAGTNGKISKIYAGGKNANVYGKATVAFSGNAGLINNFSGTVYGIGKNGAVTEGSEIQFVNYSGNFNGSIRSFDKVVISGSSNVVMTKGQHKTMKGAEYVFVLDQGHTSPMLTWNKKVAFANITVQVAVAEATEAVLIESKYFKKDADFSTSWITVTNDKDEALSKIAYDLVYTSAYEWQVNAKGKGKWVKVRNEGNVSINYKGTNATFSGEVTDRVVLSGEDDTANVTGDLKGGLDVGGGDNKINLQEGSSVAGGIEAGDGDDTLTVQKGVELVGDVNLGGGTNKLTVQKDASVSGTVVLEEGSNNTITVNGGAIAAIDGNAESNVIHLNGTIYGGGIGYWNETTSYDENGNPVVSKEFVSGNLDLRGSDSNDEIYVNQYAAVNSIYLGGGTDKLEIAANSYFGCSCIDDTKTVYRDPAAIDLGSGKNTLVLKGNLNGNVKVSCEDDAENTIVIAADLTINSNQFLMGHTNNVLIVANGVEAIFNATTVGAFQDAYKGIYLNQNAALCVGDDKIIQNFIGGMSAAGTIYVIANDNDGFQNDYYKPVAEENGGVQNSHLNASEIVVSKGAVIKGSKINANIFVRKDGVLDGVEVSGNVTLEDGAALKGESVITGSTTIMEGATVEDSTLKGDVTLDKNGIIKNSVMGGFSANIYLYGTVENSSIVKAQTVEIHSQDAQLTEITEAENVTFAVDYINEVLVVDVINTLTVNGNVEIGSLLFKGEEYDYTENGSNISLKDNVLFTIVNDQYTIANGSEADEDLAFDAGFTVEIRKALAGDVAFNDNTVIFNTSEDGAAAFIYGDITGSADFEIAANVKTFLEYNQFVDGISNFTFTLKANSFLAFDGVVSDEEKDELINGDIVNIEGDKAIFAIGSQAIIENWNGNFNIDTDLPSLSTANGVLAFTDLYVKDGGVVKGYIKDGVTDEAIANVVELGAGVVVKGSTDKYDFGAIELGKGDDKLTMNSGVEVYGTVDMGEGNDTIEMKGVEVHAAVNQAKAAVILNGGKLDVLEGENTIEGNLNIAAGDNEVTIAEGASLTVDEVVTEGAANVTLDISGTLAIDAEELVLDATNAVKVNLNEGADLGAVTELEMSGDAENTLNVNTDSGLAAIDMIGIGAANTINNKGTVEADVNMFGASNRIDNFATFTATDSLTMSGYVDVDDETDDYTTTTTVLGATTGNAIENHGTFKAADVFMTGADNSIVNEGEFTAGNVFMAGEVTLTEDKLHESEKPPVAYGAEDNGIVNKAGTMEIGNVDMTGGSNVIKNEADEELAAGSIEMDGVDNTIEGVVSADGDVDMSATDANTIKGEFSATGAIVMDGGEDDDGNVVPATTNTVEGTLKAGTDLTMFAASNTVDGTVEAVNIDMTATNGDNLLNANNAEGSITATGDLNMSATGANTINGEFSATGAIVMDGGVDADGNVLNAETNTINMNGELNAASIFMKGDDNYIVNEEGVVKVNHYANKVEGNLLSVGDITASLTSEGGIVMEGGDNEIIVAVDALANGKYEDSPLHDHAEIQIGTVTVTVEAPITMTGDTNKLDLGYTLTAKGEADITAGNATVTVAGDIDMTGTNNELDLAITLTSKTQSVLTVGDVAMSYTGNITMKADDGTNYLALGAIVDVSEETDKHSPTYSELTHGTLSASVTGDITMGGEGATNTLHVGSSATITGAITMGDYSRDVVSEANNLRIDVGSMANVTSIKLLAETNTVDFYGEGEVNDNFSVFGEDNTINVGKDVIVNPVITFNDLYDADGDGVGDGVTSGDMLIDNDSNTVIVDGIVAGIDSSATDSDDNYEIRNTAGDITTGGSTLGDAVVVGTNDDIRVNAVAGKITMGSADALSEGSNNLTVGAFTDSDGNSYTATTGDVEMYSEAGNSVVLNGVVDSENVAYTATTGAVTMVSDALNDLDANNASEINGNVTMIGNENEADIYGVSSVNGDIVMTADRGADSANSLTIHGIEAEDGALPAVPEEEDYNGTPSVMAEVSGAVTMTNFNGSNEAEICDATIGGSITMEANKLAETTDGVDPVADASNELELWGASYINKVWDAEAGTHVDSDPIDNPVTVNGDVAMTAADDNTLEAYIVSISGSVKMTAGAANDATFEDSSIGGVVDMDAETSNTLTATNVVIGSPVATVAEGDAEATVSMTAGENSLYVEDTVVNGAVEMIATTGDNDIEGVADGAASNVTIGSLTMNAADSNSAVFEDSTIGGAVNMEAGNNNTFEAYGKYVAATGTTSIKVDRMEIGNVDMTATAGSNTVTIGEDDGTDEERLGVVTLGALTMAADFANTMNVVAGSEYEYVAGPDAAIADAVAKVESVEMTGATNNTLSVDQGTLKIGDITMTNLDSEGFAKSASENSVSVDDDATLLAGNITMGSANFEDATIPGVEGFYDDVTLRNVVLEDGVEKYIFVWNPAVSPIPGTHSIFTAKNNITVNGKATAGDVEMIGRENSVILEGPATFDPNGHTTATDYDPTIARAKFGAISLAGQINTVSVSGGIADGEAVFEADSITMDNIDVNNAFAQADSNTILVSAKSTFKVNGDVAMNGSDEDDVLVAANAITVGKEVTFETANITMSGAANTITIDDNSKVKIADVNMTAVSSNVFNVGDYANENFNKEASEWTTGGDVAADADNYFNYEAQVNTIGVVNATATGFIDPEGLNSFNGTNDASFGANSEVASVTMNGCYNVLNLGAETTATRYKVNADGKAVANITKLDGSEVPMTKEEYQAYWDEVNAMPASTEKDAWIAANDRNVFNQISETVVVDNGAKITGDVTFAFDKVVVYEDGSVPTNYLGMNAGTVIGGNVTSTATVTLSDGTVVGAEDTITMDEAKIEGYVDLGKGDDILSLDDSTVGKEVNLGEGNDILSLDDSTIVGEVNLGEGNDAVSLDDSTVDGAVNLGEGNDLVELSADSTVGSIDFGASEGEFDWFASEGYDYLDTNFNILTVNGNITYSGTLVVNGTVKFANGYGFVGEGEDAKLYFKNVFVENGSIETPVNLMRDLGLVNSTVNATVTALDAADVEYGTTPYVYKNRVAAIGNVEVNAEINLGLGDNEIFVVEDTALVLNAAVTANAKLYKVVGEENVEVNAAGKTEAELKAEYEAAMENYTNVVLPAYQADLATWETAFKAWQAGDDTKTEEMYIALDPAANAKPVEPTAPNEADYAFVQGYANGTLSMVMGNNSKLTVNVADDGVKLDALVFTVSGAATAEEPATYTVDGTGKLTVTEITNDSVTGEFTSTFFKTEIAAEAKLGEGNDTVTITDAFVGKIDAWGGSNKVILDAGSAKSNITIVNANVDINDAMENTVSIAYAGTVNVNNSATIKDLGSINEIIVKDNGALASEGALSNVTIAEGSTTAKITGAEITTLNANANFALEGTNEIAEINLGAEEVTIDGSIDQAGALAVGTAGKLIVTGDLMTDSTLNSGVALEVGGALEAYAVGATDITAASVKATAAISAANVTATAGNIEAAAFYVAGAVTASADVISGSAAINAKTISAVNVSAVTDITAESITATGDVSAVNINATAGNIEAVKITATGDVSAVNIAASGDVSAVNITATDDLAAANITATGNVSAVNIAATGNISAVKITADVIVAENVTADEVDGKLTVNGTLTGTDFSAVDAGSSAATIVFNGGAEFNSTNLVATATADAYQFGTAGADDSITDSNTTQLTLADLAADTNWFAKLSGADANDSFSISYDGTAFSVDDTATPVDEASKAYIAGEMLSYTAAGWVDANDTKKWTSAMSGNTLTFTLA